MSSDALRGVVGSGPNDLEPPTRPSPCSRHVAARLRRRLSTVVDTLGTDADRRSRWLGLARDAGLPTVAVVLDTDDATSPGTQRGP